MQRILLLIVLPACSTERPITDLVKSTYGLYFDKLSNVWDEAIPPGNGMVGALARDNEGKLRISLDSDDQWDMRPMENLQTPEWKCKWVYEQWKNANHKHVQEKFDVTYEKGSVCSKNPAAVIEKASL